MNTPFKISDDQNTITHESVLVTVFVEDNKTVCSDRCEYLTAPLVDCKQIPCSKIKRMLSACRKDKKHGYFVKKTEYPAQ